MKKLIIVLGCTVLIYGCCNVENSGKLSGEIKAEIDSLLSYWHKDVADANFESYFGFMDSTSVFIGTDAAETWTKKEFQTFCKPYFDKENTWTFKALERNIYLSQSEEVAWFDEILDTWMGLCRGSGVLELSNSKWKLKHYVLSVTVPNQDIKEVIKAKYNNDSVFMSGF